MKIEVMTDDPSEFDRAEFIEAVEALGYEVEKLTVLDSLGFRWD